MATPRPATDRLAKVARRVSCTLFLDEGPVDELIAVTTALQDLITEQEATRAARLARARHDVRDEDSRAQRAAEDAVLADDQVAVEEAKERLATAEQAARAVEQIFTFRSLGRTRWRHAVQANPPSDLEHAEWKRQGLDGDPPYDTEGVMRVLLTTALVSPELSDTAIDDILAGDDWNDQEIGQLWATALAAQTQARTKDH